MAAMAGVLRNPRYQKVLRKIANMPPEERAVMNAISIQPFVDAETQKALQIMQIQAGRESAQAYRGLGEKRLASQEGIAERRLEANKELAEAGMTHRELMGTRSREHSMDLYTMNRDYQREQAKKAEPWNWAGVGVSALGAAGSAWQANKTATAYDQMANMYKKQRRLYG